MQRDMAERGHSLESIKASIDARKPDFDAFIGKSLCRNQALRRWVFNRIQLDIVVQTLRSSLQTS